ncbi:MULTISPECIES: VIT1/CCC1 transporter family protein [Haloferax]|uniref:Rubrerythrin family protein n=2 Tax=Haloferax TaxID=2251 RepID=A0A6G1Z268_9EURY|nr:MULTISPECIES: VIT1/CCC1 transporter family protein [Haloferax]KAB1187733.1 rubrerythrin family protein [Haloferax sp. CBA1149]MRW80394.1 rubrerythrin family protein [Haloferax marinisediminis]
MSHPQPLDPDRLRVAYRDEIDGAYLYDVLAGLADTPELETVYERLATSERGHADQLRALLGEDESVPSTPSWRARVLARLAGRFGPGIVLPTLTEREVDGAADYLVAGESGIAADEHGHARTLRALSETTGGVQGTTLAMLEGRHRATSGNTLRAAVLGANDGLVSNLSLVMGVAGASLSPESVLIAGLAGLVAGSGSMAMGEWLSVQSSRELYERQLSVEAAELEASPEEEAEELVLIYRAKGVPEAQATELASRLVSDRDTALDTLAREELAIDPEDLGGSAWGAAASSFVLFALGAVIPVIPFFFVSGTPAVIASLVASAIGLFAIGAGITVLTGRSLLFSGGRQVGIGLAAAALTYGIGSLVGVGLVG